MLSRQYAVEEMVLGDLLREKARTHRTETFVKLREGELTYGEVDEMADRMARGLAALGVRRRDHVALMLPNCADFLYLVFALARLGAVAVPINTAYKGEILLHVLKTSDSTLLVVDEPWLERVAAVEVGLPDLASVLVRSTEGGDAPHGLSKPTRPLSELPEAGGEAPQAQVRHFDLQAIMYTSGTTGPSKGVIVPHALALTDAQDSLRYLAYEEGETIYCPIPLFHAGALWDGMMTALLGGLSIAVVERFSASRFWDDVRHFDANVAMGIFSMIPILLNRPPTPRDKDHPLRAFYLGKSALDEEFHQRFGARSVETYTSTEVGVGTGSPYGEWRVGSCGVENSETMEVRVVDEWDREVPPGEPGELVVRPNQPYVITPGYYNFPQATLETCRNLWFHTGDRVYQDDDGYFHFVERIKDSIRRRGENISAFEVERVVNRHPAVLESAAFGVASELEEEELKVAVVTRRGADLDPAELVAFCDERLPYFAVPRFVELVRELPKTPIGKIAKHELRRAGMTAATWDAEQQDAAAAAGDK